jgi:tripartite-type tricarboxylate transporter receptor subunit TctC
MLNRRIFHSFSLGVASGAACPVIFAQERAANWPTKTVRFINSFPPGGPSDLLARSVADILQKQFNQSFIVENKPGAGGNLAATELARTTADGHTLFWGIDTTFTINPYIYPNLPFRLALNQEGNLKPLVIASSSGLMVGVHPSRGINSLSELIAVGKSKGLTMSNGGSGSPGHLAAEVFAETGVKVTHVPYRGNAPAVAALLSGEVDAGILATPGLLPHVRSGKITALAATSRQRSRLAPTIPTVSELRMRELETEVYYLVVVPTATPEPIYNAMLKAIQAALVTPQVKQLMNNMDMNLENTTGVVANAGLYVLSKRYEKTVKVTQMKVE